jgi:hypothetical protein
MALITRAGDTALVERTLGEFTRPWEWADTRQQKTASETEETTK